MDNSSDDGIDFSLVSAKFYNCTAQIRKFSQGTSINFYNCFITGQFRSSSGTLSNIAFTNCNMLINNNRGNDDYDLFHNITVSGCNIICPSTELNAITYDTTYKSVVNGTLT